MGLPILFPDQLQGHMLVALYLVVDEGKIGNRVRRTPDRCRTLAKQRLLQLDVVPVGHFRPTLSRHFRCFEILVNGTLRDRTTTGDLSLFPSQGMEPENFLDFSHGQPFLSHRWFPPGTQRAIGLSSALLLHRS